MLRSGDGRPNIVFVFADQLRADALGCYGNAESITPHMDRMASGGLRFSNAIANSPVCGPSRGSLLTGQYPFKHRVMQNDDPLPPGRETIAACLKRQGYKTGYIGKWHLDGMPRDKFTPPGPRRQGFDDYWAVYNCTHNYMDTKYYTDSPELIRSDTYEPEHQTDLAMVRIGQWAQEDTPFCLFVSWGPPHDPYPLVPERYKRLYDAPPTIRRNCPQLPGDTLRDYYAAVTALDEQLGRLLDCIAGHGLEQETIVVLTSDHGDMLGSHGYWQKQLPFEESIRIPLLIQWKERLRPGTIDALIGIADFAPTLLGLAGIGSHADMEGCDMSGAIRHAGAGAAVDSVHSSVDAGERRSVPIMNIIPGGNALKFGERRPWRGVRTERFTYARFQEEDWILYDLKQDPYQMNNLIRHPDYSDIRRMLQTELERWLVRIGDDTFKF